MILSQRMKNQEGSFYNLPTLHKAKYLIKKSDKKIYLNNKNKSLALFDPLYLKHCKDFWKHN